MKLVSYWDLADMLCSARISSTLRLTNCKPLIAVGITYYAVGSVNWYVELSKIVTNDANFSLRSRHNIDLCFPLLFTTSCVKQFPCLIRTVFSPHGCIAGYKDSTKSASIEIISTPLSNDSGYTHVPMNNPLAYPACESIDKVGGGIDIDGV